ncbi:hypothetical protein RJ55_02099 [Drechmeria coniospora]|nr:hypothetical protein RJ55_02099 [Drechmeria coniospora]
MARSTPDDDGAFAPAATRGAELRDRLAAILPKDRRFRLHHLSTPPFRTDALFSPPPEERPDRTFCEKHFLAVSVDVPQRPEKQVLVLAIEIFLFTTSHSTTLFVSKADSTGFLHLLQLPAGTASPIRQVCGAFVAHLVETRRRRNVQFIVSLFARAQGQYLFPGSVENAGKHVLDDRGLVKWWVRVLDPLISSPWAASSRPWTSAKGYLVVPGLDGHETRALIPRSTSLASPWETGHPLERISHYAREFDWVPPRCLIPRFPDDPKSRFRDELDEEAHGSSAMKTTGSWKSVQSMDLFWEMMAFRQECSSGRMTGFIWLVFDDENTSDRRNVSKPGMEPSSSGVAFETPKKQRLAPGPVQKTTPKRLFPSKSDVGNEQSSRSKADENGTTESNNNIADETTKSGAKGRTTREKKKKKKNKKLRGPIHPRLPRIKTELRNYLADRPTCSKYYYWPVEGRGERIVSEGDYKRIVELLLHLDFATLDKATGSTKRWVAEAGMRSRWGIEVTGQLEPSVSTRNGDAAPATGHVNNLSMLVKRKRSNAVETKDGDGESERKPAGAEPAEARGQATASSLDGGEGMPPPRKLPKV